MKENCSEETINFCATRWSTLASGYTSENELPDTLWKELEKAYCSSGRYYHTLHHIRYMLGKLEEYRAQVKDVPTLQFSIFYHDFVYSPSRSDNEERSAGKAAERLQTLGVPAPTIEKCISQILATKAHTASPDADTNLLTDIDLAILGEPWPLYQAYTQQVRKEYALYPDFIYKRGRRSVLEHFLRMNRIYKTVVFYNRYEEQARANLTQELRQL
ncbi:HD domain-containing protein [Botryobacter ruber]|uniref:HD domain-containing protein n=1 Tax=Botryobacter ruber TaxID=2171629 RepID=UPI000E0BCFFB|nr:hypothetical protein [Botryobacter ruber]